LTGALIVTVVQADVELVEALVETSLVARAAGLDGGGKVPPAVGATQVLIRFVVATVTANHSE